MSTLLVLFPYRLVGKIGTYLRRHPTMGSAPRRARPAHMTSTLALLGCGWAPHLHGLTQPDREIVPARRAYRLPGQVVHLLGPHRNHIAGLRIFDDQRQQHGPFNRWEYIGA